MIDPCRYRLERHCTYSLYLAKGPAGVWIGITSEDFDAPGFVCVFERGDREAEAAADVRGFSGVWVPLSDFSPTGK